MTSDVNLRKRLVMAALLGGAVVVAYAVATATRLGWLGVGIIGLLVTLIAVRLDLHGGKAVPGGRLDKGSVDLLVHQLRADEAEGRAPPPPDKTAIHIARGVGIVFAVLGIGMFVVQNLHAF